MGFTVTFRVDDVFTNFIQTLYKFVFLKCQRVPLNVEYQSNDARLHLRQSVKFFLMLSVSKDLNTVHVDIAGLFILSAVRYMYT